MDINKKACVCLGGQAPSLHLRWSNEDHSSMEPSNTVWDANNCCVSCLPDRGLPAMEGGLCALPGLCSWGSGKRTPSTYGREK